MTYLKNIAVLLLLNLCVSAALAGPEVESFKNDVAALQAVQGKNPNRIVRYADADGGKLAKAVLDPSRVSKIVAECREEINAGPTLKLVLDKFAIISNNYEIAFQQLPGKYDAEYLDSFATTYLLLNEVVSLLQTIAPEQIEDENKRKMLMDLLSAMKAGGAMLLQDFENKIATGKFSSASKPQAQALLDRLKSGQFTSPVAQDSAPKGAGH